MRQGSISLDEAPISVVAVSIVTIAVLSLVLFVFQPLIGALALFFAAAIAVGPTKPKAIAVLVMAFLWVNDIVADFSPFSQYTAWKDVLLLMALIGWLARTSVQKRSLLPASAIAVPYFVVISFFVANCALSPSLVNAVLGLKATIFYMMWVVVIQDVVHSKRDVLLLFWAIMFGTLCLAIYNLIRIQFPYGFLPMRRGYVYVTGAMAAHWSGSVFTLAYGVILGVAMLPVFRLRTRLLLNGIVFLAGIGLLVTTVRATIAATFVSLLTLAFLSRRYGVMWKILAVAAVAGVVLQSAAKQELGERMLSSLDPEDTSRQVREQETRERSLPYVLEHPFGGGTGVMTAGASAAAWAANSDVPLALRYGIVHNNFMLVAMEIGWLGLLAWIWLVVTLIVTAFTIYTRARDDLVRHVALGLFGIALYYLLMHPFQRTLTYQQQPVMFWTLMGLLTVLPRLERESAREVAQEELRTM